MSKRHPKVLGWIFFAVFVAASALSNPSAAQWFDFGNGLISLNQVSRIYGRFSISISNSDPQCTGPLASEIDVMTEQPLTESNIDEAIKRINARPGCFWNISAKIEFFEGLVADRKFTLTLASGGDHRNSTNSVADLRESLKTYGDIVQLVNAKRR